MAARKATAEEWSSSGSEASEPAPLDPHADDGWKDVEPDEEGGCEMRSFFDERVFQTLPEMLEHCKREHGFDFLALRRSLGATDFYDTIKLINFIREHAGSPPSRSAVPNITSKAQFADDRFLQPVLEGDAALFCIDELEDEPETETETGPVGSADCEEAGPSGASAPAVPSARVRELEERLVALQLEYDHYRQSVAETMGKRLAAEPDPAPKTGPTESSQDKIDSGYFDSYSYNDIHETMLKDAVRTDAYRDFIYNNKDLFAGKTVLDIGCGTGILSMFCARAGAARVIAVDNSAILAKAQENVATNGLGHIISCHRGKIEEVSLPVGPGEVDVIVSEWMGYCLTFEAMLDSVLWARDRYLRPDGLMVPSHCSLVVAPVSDPDHIADKVAFWDDVYGFDMSAMKDKIHEDVQVRQPAASAVIGRPAVPFNIFDLHTTTVADLRFTRPFSVTVDGARAKEQEQDATGKVQLDGFAIWFDTFFLPPNKALPPNAFAARPDKEGEYVGPAGSVSFTTGPDGPNTHWFAGVLMAQRSERAKQSHPLSSVKPGQTITGSVTYERATTNSRGLEITVEWTIEGETDVKDKMSWTLD